MTQRSAFRLGGLRFSGRRAAAVPPRILPVTAAVSVCAMLAAAPVLSQDVGTPPALFIDIDKGLEFEDRLDQDDRLTYRTILGLGYFTSTTDQRLSFEGGVTARLREEDGFDLVNPFATLDYARFNRNYEIGFDLSYRRAEIEGDDLDDDFDAEDLARQDGTRERIDLGFRLVTGRASPFGTDTELRYGRATFADGATDDDTQTHSARSTLRFTVDPRIILTVTGFWQREETDDLVDTVDTTHRLTFGADLAIDRVWSASARLGYAEQTTETNLATVSEEGLEGSLVLTRALPNGSLSFSSDHAVTTDGWRNSVRISRAIETASGDTFNASIGQIFFEEGGSGHLASVAYTRTVRSGFLAFGLDYSSDLDGADFLVQRVTANALIRQDITDVSGWSLDGSLASVHNDNPATPDAVRFDIGLAYLHALSNDWNLAARIEHQVLYEDGDLDDRTNVVSLNFERRFSVRP